eukprot:14294-Heterococcus_DN1.PRE.2
MLPLLLLVTDSCCSSEDCAAASMIAGALLVSRCTHTAPGTADSDFAAAGAVACMALASLFSNYAPAIAARLCTLPLRVLSVQLQLLLLSIHSKPQQCTHTGISRDALSTVLELVIAKVAAVLDDIDVR